MNDKKNIESTTEGASIASMDVIDPVWHKPDEEKKPKGRLKLFTVSYSEVTKKITLDVDGEEYRTISVKDNISGNRKYYEGVDKMIKLFSDWGYYENSN
tara:strand:- start:130 stop:426 length:297 start_codon:yes stop_codon:yes gene_type:complete